MQGIFQNTDLQKQFNRDGYLVLPWLSQAETQKLREVYASLCINNPEGFHSTSFLADTALKKKINEAVESIFDKNIHETFSEIKKLGASFLTKPPGEKGEMPVHQDWTIVDETNYCSVTIWVALEDITEQNGAMQVLPGSHLFSQTLRAPTLETDYAHLQDYLRTKMITISMKAGEAIIFNHALFHASLINKTDKPRLAVTYGLIPDKAQLSLYIKTEPGKAARYEMPDDMFLYYHEIGTKPSCGVKTNEVSLATKAKSALYFEQKINQYIAAAKAEKIFKDEAVQQAFDKDGYAVLPLLNKDEVDNLLHFYQSVQIKDDAGFGFHISMDQADKSLVTKISDKLFEAALPKMSAHFENAKSFVASYVIKESNPTGVVPVHQDWTFVEDEERHCSLTCWVALVDTNLENGAMALIKGSHRFFKNYRPSPSPQVPSPLSEHMFTIFPYLQMIEMKAGEMLVFDNRTFHGSPPNTSSSPRIAFGIGMTQHDARLVHYYLNPKSPGKNEIFKYGIDKNFFKKYENATLSKMYDRGETIKDYPVEATVPFELPKFTADELIDLIKENGNEFNVPMCEKLAKLFNYNLDGSKKAEPKVEYPKSSLPEAEKPWVWEDNRSFSEKYTPLNILKEIKKRLTA
jgi:ectoine hydroxylase-related dioxygenase (phytanoyl-CoA dioxygenase family)